MTSPEPPCFCLHTAVVASSILAPPTNDPETGPARPVSSFQHHEKRRVRVAAGTSHGPWSVVRSHYRPPMNTTTNGPAIPDPLSSEFDHQSPISSCPGASKRSHQPAAPLVLTTSLGSSCAQHPLRISTIPPWLPRVAGSAKASSPGAVVQGARPYPDRWNEIKAT